MLAAAIFASSVTPSTDPAEGAPAGPVAIATPPPAAPVAAAPQRTQIFPDQTGNLDFGAPMIETTPAESGMADPALSTAPAGSAEAAGGRQFYATPGRPFPVPR